MRDFVPDRLLFNGNIVTVDQAFSFAEAVAIHNDRIVAVGNDADIRPLAGNATETVDLNGRCVLPGQIDSYAHFIYSGVDLLGDRGKVNIINLRSVHEVVAAIRRRAATTPPDEWVATSCMYRGRFDDGRWPNIDDLDAAAPDHPVYIMQGGRPIIANSRALALAGIDRDTPDPTHPPGKIVRDAQGNLTGQLLGGAADLARKQWASRIGESGEHWDFSFFDRGALVEAIRAQQEVFHACGVTTIRDSDTTRTEVDALLLARDEGVLRVRTAMAISLPDKYLDDDGRKRLFESYFGPWDLGDNILWTWGVSMTHTLDGWTLIDKETLRYCVSEASRRGWTVAITPSIGGDSGPISAVLTSIEELGQEDLIDRRWSLFHPEALREKEDIARAARLGLTVNPNPLLNYRAAARSRDMHEEIKATGLHQGLEDDPMDQTRSMWGMHVRDWLAGGLVVSAGSNTPAVVYDEEHPFLGQYCALTGDTSAGVLLPDQAIGREDMIRIFTSKGAFALKRDQHLGSIEPGKLADLIVLDRNILTCDERDVADLRILQTYVGGELVYET